MSTYAITADTPLPDVLAAYLDDRPSELAASTVAQYGWHVGRFSKWLGREATVADLTEPRRVDEFLAALRDQGLATATRMGNRVALVTLWNWLFDEDLVDRPPKIKRLREPKTRTPIAWRPDEIRALVDACPQVRGSFRCLDGSTIAKGPYLRSLVLALFSSGLRLADCLGSLRWEDVEADGTIRVVCAKTRREVVRRLSPETLDAIRTMDPRDRVLVWPMPSPVSEAGGRRAFFRGLQAAVKIAGIRPGTSKFLRRAAATQIANRHGLDAARRFCDHRDTSTTRQNYLDPTQIDGEVPTIDLSDLS